MGKRQTMFGRTGELVTHINGLTPAKRKRYEAMQRELDRRAGYRAVCPFCLLISTVDRFTQVNEKSFIVKKTFTCPECGQNMKQPTLFIVDRGPEEYSGWFWDQVFSFKGYDRMSWEIVKRRVKEMGFSDVFWETWKEKKSERGK